MYGFILLSLTCFFCCLKASDVDFTVNIAAGYKECFHQKVSSGHEIDVEFQVVDGGDMDIDFTVTAPSGRTIVNMFRKQEGSHKLKTEENGDYHFCLDNGFSSFSHKMVYFELITDEMDATDQRREVEDLPQTQEVFDMAVDDVKTKLDEIKDRLERSIQSQGFIRNYEIRDRNTIEQNFERINFWSGVQLFVMFTVGFIQVVMIRGLFDENGRLAKMFKART